MRSHRPERAAEGHLPFDEGRVHQPQHGPNITSISEVAFTPPTVSVTRANTAGVASRRRRSARDARPISQGSPAKGNRITEMRAAYVAAGTG